LAIVALYVLILTVGRWPIWAALSSIIKRHFQKLVKIFPAILQAKSAKTPFLEDEPRKYFRSEIKRKTFVFLLYFARLFVPLHIICEV